MMAKQDLNVLMITRILLVACMASASASTCEASKYWECKDQAACNALTLANNAKAAWKDNSCKQCGNHDVSGCVEKASCEGVKPHSGTAVWWQEKSECRTCSKDILWGCTQAMCPGAMKLDNNATAVWKDNSCKKCGSGDVSGCVTQASCEGATPHSGTAVWWQDKSECRTCSKDSLWGCTQAMCPGTMKLDNNASAAWKDNSCKKCGNGDLSGCVTKASCEGAKPHSGTAVWWQDRSECRTCSKDSLWGCTQAMCGTMKLDDNATAAWKDNSCKKCGGVSLDGCVTRASCEAVKLSPGTWWEDKNECRVCAKHSTGGCSQAACTALKLDNNATTVWKDNECRKCGDGDASGCTTKTACEGLTASSGSTFVWWEDRNECRSCSKHSLWGCKEAACKTMKPDGGAIANWMAREGHCAKCGAGDLGGCITEATCLATTLTWGKAVWSSDQKCRGCGLDSLHGCTKADCAALKPRDNLETFNWSPMHGSMYCGKCGKGSSEGCITKATCEAVTISHGKPVWRNGMCKTCGKHSTDGCATKPDCESIKFEDPADTAVWKCNQKCERCGPSDPSGCPTKVRCESVKLSGGNKAVWNEADKRCKRCGPDSMSGCSEADCVSPVGAVAGVGKGTVAWDAKMKECKSCGKDDVGGCTTKVDCEKAKLSWGKNAWSEALQKCVRCGKYDVSGCLTQSECVSVTMRETQLPAKWDADAKWCSSGCSRRYLNQCTTKAACEGVSRDGEEVIQWNVKTSKCEMCSSIAVDNTCRDMYQCMPQTTMYQEFCCQASVKFKCAAHCSVNKAECLQWGIGETGDSAQCPAKPAFSESTFAVKVAVAEATKFDAKAYTEKLAEETGVQAQHVEIVKTEFVIEVGFKFSADKAVTKADATTAIASAWAVNESKVEVTILSRRRLNEIRQLATTDTKVTAKLKTEDPVKADSVKTSAGSTTGTAAVNSKLSTATGVTVVTVVEKQPTIEVEITTKVKSTTPIAKPTTDAMNKVALAAGGTGATVDTTSWNQQEIAGTPAGEAPGPASAGGGASAAWKPTVQLSSIVAFAAVLA